MLSQTFTIMLCAASTSKKSTRTTVKKVPDVAFFRRQQARQWCRNNWYKQMHSGMVIVHPDGHYENFEWDGETIKT